MGYCRNIIILLLLVVLIYPPFTIYPLLIIDFFTPWSLFESNLFSQYHDFIISQLSDKDEMPIPELHAHNMTKDDLASLSNGYTFPVVVRGALKDSPAVKHWGDKDWWLENYPDNKVLCGYVDRTEKDPFCTVREFFEGIEKGEPFYISGGSSIFDKNPELRDMIESDFVHDNIEMNNDRVATQVFMGLPDMGSDLHNAIGCNVFRQIAGRKKWWFIPPSWTAYVFPSININGFSSHTKTLIGKGGDNPSPWLGKLLRYTAELEVKKKRHLSSFLFELFDNNFFSIDKIAW